MATTFGFPVADELQHRIEDIVKEIRATNNKRQFALKAFQIVSDLSDVGLDYFFIQSLKRAKFGPIKIMAVENALKIGKKAVLTITKKIMKNMNDEQLAVVADLFEECLVQK